MFYFKGPKLTPNELNVSSKFDLVNFRLVVEKIVPKEYVDYFVYFNDNQFFLYQKPVYLHIYNKIKNQRCATSHTSLARCPYIKKSLNKLFFNLNIFNICVSAEKYV